MRFIFFLIVAFVLIVCLSANGQSVTYTSALQLSVPADGGNGTWTKNQVTICVTPDSVHIGSVSVGVDWTSHADGNLSSLSEGQVFVLEPKSNTLTVQSKAGKVFYFH